MGIPTQEPFIWECRSVRSRSTRLCVAKDHIQWNTEPWSPWGILVLLIIIYTLVLNFIVFCCFPLLFMISANKIPKSLKLLFLCLLEYQVGQSQMNTLVYLKITKLKLCSLCFAYLPENLQNVIERLKASSTMLIIYNSRFTFPESLFWFFFFFIP